MIYLGDKPVGIVNKYMKSGTFTGSDTNSQALDIGFEPDIITVSSDLDISESGWTGIKSIVIAKGILTVNDAHLTATTTVSTAQACPLSAEDPWGENITANYKSKASYSNGVLTLSNNNRLKFRDDTQYRWTAYKA